MALLRDMVGRMLMWLHVIPTDDEINVNDPFAAFLAWDDFNRPDQVGLGTAPKGGTWLGSTYNIISGTAVPQQSASNTATLDVGVSDFTAQLDILKFLWLVFRYQDDSNMWVAGYTGATTVQLRSIAAGAQTSHGSVTVATAGSVNIDARGQAMVVSVNGVQKITYTDTANYLINNTRVGMFGAHSEADAFDNFWVKP